MAAWLVVVVVALVWGTIAIGPVERYAVTAAPLRGHWGWYPRPGLLVAVALAAGLVAGGPRFAATAPWRRLLAATGASGAAWAVALGAASGWSRLTATVTDRHQYEPFAAGIGDAGAFLEGFTERIGDYPTHVRGHPPFATLTPFALDRVGLGGAGWFAALIVAGWAVAGVSVLIAVRAVAGEATARRAAPGIVVLPAALWATAADGLFAGVGALAVALCVLAVTRRSPWLALLGGGAFAAAVLLTYGAALLAVIPLAVAVRHRAWGPLALMAAPGSASLVGVWAATGFWWFEGLAATRAEYWMGLAAQRPTPYFVLAGNPGALALAAGPAVAAGLTGIRRLGPAAVLPLAALFAVVVADLSLLSKAEVERIWLLFVPWLAVATAALDRHPRRWLAAQAAIALVLHVVLRGQ